MAVQQSQNGVVVENMAAQQTQDRVVEEDVLMPEIPVQETVPEPSSAVLEIDIEQQQTGQPEFKIAQVETATAQTQPEKELVQLDEPEKAEAKEENEKCLQPTANSAAAAATSLENNSNDKIDENKEQQQRAIVEQKDQQNVVQSVAVPENSGLDAIDRALNNEPMHYSSDEEIKKCKPEISVAKNSNEVNSNSDSSDSSNSSSDSDSDSDDDENSRKRGNDDLDGDDLSDDNDDNTEGPVKSAHEILDEPAPKIPENLKITPQTQLEHVGEIFSVTGKTVVIKASVSGEFRVLDDHSVFCTGDRVPFGVLYETFGRVQAPFYSVKFESEEEAAAFKPRRGEKVFYVVSASKFLFTDRIKAIKGSDASNFHDEEIPEEEQEFSDDEKERMASSTKKTKKKKKKTKHDDADRAKTGDDTGATVVSTAVSTSSANTNSSGNSRPLRNNRGKPARGRGGFQGHPNQSHANNNNNNNFSHPLQYQNSYNNLSFGQSRNHPNGGGNFGQQLNQQYNPGFSPAGPGVPYYNPQQQMFNQQQYNPQQPYFNTQQQGAQQHNLQQQQQHQQHQQQQFYNPLQQHQFQMMQQIMMNLNNNAARNQVPPPASSQQQQGPPMFSYQQQQQQHQQQPQGPPGRQGPPRSYDTDLNYGGSK